jgi:hypothetical protein
MVVPIPHRRGPVLWSAGAVRLRDHANHAVAVAGRPYAERAVEAAAHVLQRDHVRQLDDLGVAEVRAERGEQLVRNVGRRAAHADGVVQDHLLLLGECPAGP